ncbi:Glycylpeptide N-tetradecanoyltransferase 1 [Sciurus carolinensis]|uniref:Glycylpeptide N-tetradecanoyltransferase n=1 Tax=Sciurus carolinensis TaxID=30640 RepID=A0AA41T8S8_SCICA|nr:Glycylpeptide N-tetradecanoyltransferase 1 [Sciurus carolinensis]
MADESETAVKPPAPQLPQMMEGNGNGHEHCSDCENEEDNSYNRGGLSPANDTGAKKKKKKQKKKKEKGNETDSTQDQPVKMNSLPAERIQEIQKAIELFSVGQGPAKTMEEASKRSYQFWDTQPVPKLGEVVNTHGPVEPDKDNIRQEPYTLPQGFTWDALDLGDRGVLKELYTLLNENYVEDDDNMFRFDYSPEFLLWALRPPGWLPQWHCGVRVVSSRKLVGFISAIPANIHIYDTEKKMVEINFLCVHKKLRSKRVAPVLIREITRRVHLEGIFQAVYTAGVVLPKPVGTCRYWHRSLNPRKLIEVKFSHLSRNMTMQRTMKLYRLPEASGTLGWAGTGDPGLGRKGAELGGRGRKVIRPIVSLVSRFPLLLVFLRGMTPKTAGLRPMEKKDIPVVHQLLTRYLKQFHLTPVMSQEEVEHWFYPQENIIDTFVVENANGEVTDFLSFYTLPSTIMNHPTHKSLKAAYSFYNVHTQTPLLDLMSDALVLAKMKGFDVFNALDLMENKTFLEKLKFGIGDGNLQYYLYNWKCPSMGAEKTTAAAPVCWIFIKVFEGAPFFPLSCAANCRHQRKWLTFDSLTPRYPDQRSCHSWQEAY